LSATTDVRTILVVDDQDDLRETLVAYLEYLPDCRILSAKSGREALEIMDMTPVGMVITDMLMPDMEGIETIHEIRKRHPDTIVVAMSGGGRTGNMDFLDMAKDQGVYGVIRKPFDLDELGDLVEKALYPD